MNSICIIGNLTGDYESKYMPSGKPIGSFTLAHNDGYGENKHVSYFDVTVFGTRADKHGEYIGKGSKVSIEGSIRQDRWDGQDGTKRSKIKIVARNINYLDGKPKDTHDDPAPF